MKRVMQLFIAICLFQLVVQNATAQPFKHDIALFKQRDSVLPPPQNAILFIGSSSFTKWTNMQEAFPLFPIINRGFGGSTLPDVIRYANDIIFPYQPKQIIIYCGDNDIAFSDTITAEIVLQRFKQLYSLIRSRLKYTEIDFVSVKPSPSRWKFKPVMEASNRLIRQFILQQSHANFIDVYHAMLDEKGNVREDLFIEDKLHMNAKGYAIWTQIISKYLLQ